MVKKTLSARLDPDLICRLKEVSKANGTTIDRTISLALDAFEREQKAGHAISQRVDFLEKSLSAVLDLVVTFSEKMDEKFSEASTLERERLKSLYKLVEIKMSEHDEAEEVRYCRFLDALRKENNS